MLRAAFRFFSLMFMVALTYGQDSASQSTANIKSEKKVLVFTLDVVNAKKTIAENLTEKMFLEMTSTPGIRVNYIRNESKIPENHTQEKSDLYKRGMECSKVECSAEIAKALGYDFSMIGKIERQGGGYALDVKVVEASTKSPAFEKDQKFRQGKVEVINALPTWGARISRIIAEPNFAKALAPPVAEAGEAKKSEEPEKGWKSPDFDPFTAHLKGTRIFGTLTDTLKISESPYIVTSNLIIPSGTELIIEKGVTVFVGGEYTTITVQGQIIAKGTEQYPIVFKSGKKDKANWDWDRIFFRSRERSLLEYVHIQNSNYGVVVKDGAVTLSHCEISNNSVRGLYLENSNVEIVDSKIFGGHLIGIQVGDYGEAVVERSNIYGNHNGISVLDYGTLLLRQSKVESNDRGLILMDSVSLTLESSQITKNRIGVVSSSPMSSSVFAGLKGNQTNLESVRREKIEALVEKPAAVKVKRKSKVVSSQESKEPPKEFKGGVQSLSKDGGAYAGLIGNVTIGEGYHYPTTPKNTTLDMITTSTDSVMPGEQLPQNRIIPGFYHTASIYTTLDMAGYSIDGNAEFKYDDWGTAQLDVLSLKTKIGPNNFGVGDFSESGSEISISGLQVRGVKYGLGLLKDRNDNARLKISATFGESERPYDEGERVLGSYNERKSAGSAVAQKLVGIAKIEASPTKNWDLNFKYIYSNDKRDGILRNSLSSTAVTTDAPLLSNLMGMETQYRLMDEAITLFGEINVGTVDSTSLAYNKALERVLSSELYGYELSETEISGFLPLLQPTTRETFRDSNFNLIPTALLDSAELVNEDGLTPSQVNQRRVELIEAIMADAEIEEPEIQDELNESKNLGFRWDNQGMAARVGTDLNIKGNAFNFSYVFVGNEYYTGGNRYLTKDMRKYEMTYGRDLNSKLNLNLDYFLSVENSSSDGRYLNLLGFGEGSEFGLLADDSWQKKQENKDAIRPKFTHKLNYKNRYNMTSTTEFEFKAGLQYKSEIRGKELSNDTNVVYGDPYFDAESNVGREFSYNNSPRFIDGDLADEYSSSILDEEGEEIPLARVLDDKELSYNLGLKSKYRFSKLGNFSLQGDWKWKNDMSEYLKTGVLDNYPLQDSTLVNLGFYPNGEDEFSQDYKFALSLKMGNVTNKFDVKYSLKNKIKREEDQSSWNLKEKVVWKAIPRKLTITLEGNVKQKVTDEDEERKFVLSQGTKYYRYSNDDGALVGKNAKNSTSITLSTPDSLFDVVQEETFRGKTRENDYSMEMRLRYSFNSKLYTETMARKEWSLRPDQLDQEFEDLWAEVKVFYSF